MNRQEVNALVRSYKLYNWQVAEEMGISDCELSRRTRHSLDEKAVNAIKAAIERLVQKREQEEK